MTAPHAPAATRPAGRDASWRLAHALVADVCAGIGVEPIVIKGAVASAHGLRPHREAGDLDVLVPPHALDAIIARLQAQGWRLRARDHDELLFPSHAVTLFREGWPIDLDIHYRYLGLPPAPGSAYELVRRLSRPQLVDGVEVLAPLPAAHAVLVGLHCLRSPAVGRHAAELEQLVAAFDRVDAHRVDVHAIDVHAVIDAARDLGAVGPLRPLLARPDVLERVRDADRRETILTAPPSAAEDEWSLIASSERPHERRALQLHRATWSQRVRLIGRWLRPSLDDLYKNRDSVRRTGVRTAGLYLRRIFRGLTLLPLAVLGLMIDRPRVGDTALGPTDR
ncbi:nucleotidyltransferase family protein [Leifsonia sp. F6_8S_P_1B]|uniref:Nucleotidyltransferase family protein n=1 Tax=Leifsonia williamsii TaxID=3035919 RepID=A0ABT8KF60_9MICO|nr:nucleotidyltransferase family protein [Leifsonia williamsii]MDN4616086.1 nucleotidyltransferase family protein [Leifsonia williamsii]